MVWHGHRGLLAHHGVFREHAVEVGAEAVGQVVGLDRAAEPVRMEAADNFIADRETADAVSNGGYFAGAVAERHNPELRRSPAAALQHHQITVVERSRVHPQENFAGSGPRIVARAQHHAVNAAKAIDAISFHFWVPPWATRCASRSWELQLDPFRYVYIAVRHR